MKVTIIITAIVVIITLLYIIQSKTKSIPKDIDCIEKPRYKLLLGNDAKEIFIYYGAKEMHGLSLAGANIRISEGGTYIDGLANYDPFDKDLSMKDKPFLFLNISSLQNNYGNDKAATCVMHECMHMAGILFDGMWDSHEEEMISWAEHEANEIVKLLKDKNYI